jgi:hypothetical protein
VPSAHAHHLFLHGSVNAAPGMPSAGSEAANSVGSLNCQLAKLDSSCNPGVHINNHLPAIYDPPSIFLPTTYESRLRSPGLSLQARAIQLLSWGQFDTELPNRYTRKGSAARTMNRTRLIALGCDVAQCSTHDPRSRCHRMHDTVFGIEDVHDLNSAHM